MVNEATGDEELLALPINEDTYFEGEEGDSHLSKQDDEIEGTDPEDEMTNEEEEIEQVYEINTANWAVEPIEGEDVEEQVVLLTIDDAPHTYSSRRIRRAGSFQRHS